MEPIKCVLRVARGIYTHKLGFRITVKSGFALCSSAKDGTEWPVGRLTPTLAYRAIVKAAKTKVALMMFGRAYLLDTDERTLRRSFNGSRVCSLVAPFARSFSLFAAFLFAFRGSPEPHGVAEEKLLSRFETSWRVCEVESRMPRRLLESGGGVAGGVGFREDGGVNSGEASSLYTRVASASMACWRSGRASTSIWTTVASPHAEYRRPLRV